MSTETVYGRSSSAARTARFLTGAILVLAAGADAQFAPIGLSSVRAQAFFNEELEGFPPEVGDRFAWALAAGDFNGDGAQDLATGIPFDDGPTDLPLWDPGAVIVRWGAPGTGLATTPPPTHLSLYAAGGQDIAHDRDRFGYALAVGNFNGDQRCIAGVCRPIDDLAVGIPGHDYWDFDWENDWESGAVLIHYGEPGGIQIVGEHLFESGPDGNIPDIPEGLESLGHALAAGDFDGDGYDDLAIGGPQLGVSEFQWGGGGVVVLHGDIGGLMPVSGYLIYQDDPPVPDDGEDPDDFGYALAAGNFNGDLSCASGVCRPIDDLAMSAPGEDGIGAVMVMLGSENDLIFENSIYFGQGDLGLVGEADDRFGTTLTTGNFNGDVNCPPPQLFICTPLDDLAIGTPNEDIGPANERVDAGEVIVLFGVNGGAFDGSALLWQGGLYGSAQDETGDRFGAALAAGDFDGDGRDDLAIGQPGENGSQGGTTVVMGGTFGFDGRHRLLAAGSEGIPPGVQNSSEMGRALAVGDFDDDGHADLAIGIPYRDQAGIDDAGAETILYGALFADGFESGNRAYWSMSTP